MKKNNMEEETLDVRFEQIRSGIKLIKDILKHIKEPASASSMKELKSSTELLNKKYKMLLKNEALQVQYLDRTAFDTIQGVFQAFHLYIISCPDNDLVESILTWLRVYENCYSISDRMKAAANARADFATGGKK